MEPSSSVESTTTTTPAVVPRQETSEPPSDPPVPTTAAPEPSAPEPTTPTTLAPSPSTTTAAPNTPTTTTTTASPGQTPVTPIVPPTSTSSSSTTTRAPTARPTTKAPGNETINIDAGTAIDYTKIWAPVVGGVVGGLLLVGLLGIIICFRVRRIRNNRKLLAAENVSGSDTAPGVSLPTNHFDTLSPSQEQETMADYVYKLGEAFKRNKFSEVSILANEMYEILGYKGLSLPNPSNIFIAMIRVMETDQFLHADPRRQLDVVRVTHRIAALSLLEKAHRGTRLSEDSKQKITNNITVLKRIANVEKGSVDRPDEFEMNFHLDCLSQCLFLMEDTSLSADKLVRAVSNVTNPGVLMGMISSEIEITPRAWYRPILVASLLSHIAREDENALLSLMTRPALYDKISAEATWRTAYHHAMMLGEILSAKSSTENTCMMALKGEIVDSVKLTDKPLVDLASLLKFGTGNGSSAISVRAKAFCEVYKAVTKTPYHSVRSASMMLLLERRIHETSPNVRALIDQFMNQAVISGGLLDQWRQEINGGSEHVVEELNEEWRQLQEDRGLLSQRKNEYAEISRLLAMKNVELNELQSRVERKRASMTFQSQLAAIEKASAELKQIKKEEAYELDNVRAKEIVLRRIELEEMLDTLPNEEVKRVGRLEDVIRKLDTEVNNLSGELSKCSADVEWLEKKVRDEQYTFDIKRHNFETVQRDFRLAALLSVQEIENKTRSIDGGDRVGSLSNIDPFKDQLLRTPEQSPDAVAINIRDDSDVPSAFICPITHQIMDDPVFVIDTGHTYERAAIEKWFEKNNTDPMTGVKVSNKILAPNHSLRKLIEDYKL